MSQTPESNWSYLLTSKTMDNLGEFTNVHSSKVDINLNKVRTASLGIRLDNPLASVIAETVAAEPLYIKGYRNGILLFTGQVQSMQESYTEDQKALMQLNAAGQEFLFAQRTVGRTYEGVKYAAGTQLAIRFKGLLEALQAEANGKMRIAYGEISSTNTGAFEATYFKKASEILAEMYNQLAGFDWTVYPQEPDGEGNIGLLEIEDVIGTEQPNALFEWGAGRSNVATFTRTVDMSTMMNLGWNIAGSGPEATGAPTLSNANFEAALKATAEGLQAVWGLREDMVSASILNETMRKVLLEESVNVRMRPRQTVVMQPIVQLEGEEAATKVPVFGQDYNIGDFVPLRIAYEGSNHFNAMVRAWGVSFTNDENGKETQTLTLSDT